MLFQSPDCNQISCNSSFRLKYDILQPYVILSLTYSLIHYSLQIMLGLVSHEPHFSLLREEVRFGKQSKRYDSKLCLIRL